MVVLVVMLCRGEEDDDICGVEEKMMIICRRRSNEEERRGKSPNRHMRGKCSGPHCYPAARMGPSRLGLVSSRSCLRGLQLNGLEI